MLLAGVSLSSESIAADTPLVLLAQPLPADERTVHSYEPLARYLETLIGRRWAIETPGTFTGYWSVLRRKNYDLALDGPHFTDYRTQKFGFVVLAKLPDSASYSLIRRSEDRVVDPMQLVGRRIATLGMLSTGYARLSAIFPNPIRQPVLIEVASTAEGIALLLDKKVEAAFLPTAVANNRLPGGSVATILTTEPVTQLILSASPRLDPAMREKIRDALLTAHENPNGRAMLQALELQRFEKATPESFANQRNALRSYWGY